MRHVLMPAAAGVLCTLTMGDQCVGVLDPDAHVASGGDTAKEDDGDLQFGKLEKN